MALMNSQADNEPSALPVVPPKGAMLTIFAIVLVDMLGFGLIIPLLPKYARTFNASPLQVTLLFAIFSICQFLATPILGAWSDRIGRRPILILSLIGNAFGYALLGWATQHEWTNLALGLWTIYLSRIIAGLTAGNISAAQAYMSDITTLQNRTKGMGVLGAAFGIGFSIGPALGSFVAWKYGPSAPSWLATAMALSAAALCWWRLCEAKVHRATATNYLNISQFAPLFSNKPLMKVNASWFLCMCAFVAVDSAIVMFLADIFKYETEQIGFYFLLVGFVIMVTQGGLVGRLSRHYSEWSMCIVGILLNGLGAVLTALTAWWVNPWLLGGAAVMYAFGRSLFQPSISALVSHHSDADKQGLSFGFFQGVGTLGRIIGPIIAGYIYMSHPTSPWFGSALLLYCTAAWLLILHVKEQRKLAYSPTSISGGRR